MPGDSPQLGQRRSASTRPEPAVEREAAAAAAVPTASAVAAPTAAGGQQYYYTPGGGIYHQDRSRKHLHGRKAVLVAATPPAGKSLFKTCGTAVDSEVYVKKRSGSLNHRDSDST